MQSAENETFKELQKIIQKQTEQTKLIYEMIEIQQQTIETMSQKLIQLNKWIYNFEKALFPNSQNNPLQSDKNSPG